MSYKEKPILKLYKYENNSFIQQAIIDDYQECSFERNLYQAGAFTITINYNIPNALLFQRGLFVQFGNDPYDFGEIITISDSIGSDGKGSQIRTITGYDSRYILKRRVIKNMNSNGTWVMTAKGELCIRNLIKDQCGESAEAKRQLPIINTIPDSSSAIGKEYSVSEQFTNLYEVCKTIATQSEIGWRLNFDGASLTLECYEGEDKSQTVQFSTNFDSLANGEFSDSSESYSNAIYVGGKGQNDDRDIYEGEDGTPEGLDRFESWDNQSSMTTDEEYEAEALSMLTQYGQTVTMNGNGLAKCPYIYKEQYNVGDWITVSFSGKSAVVQILSVTEHWSWGAYDIQFSFGKPLNNLSDQLQLMLRKIQSASEKTQSTDSVRWYTIPTDTAMPKADVTYNTIGFEGNVGSGATFTLYLDNAKTGSKTYHVYFKQLAGSGKLTLTTGKAGATNLVLSVGTYVAIIYIDENGNITTQGATATDVIQTGNTQPATSGGVASAISNFNDWVVKTDANDCYYDLTTTDIRRTFFIARTGSSTTNHTPSTYRNWIIESYQSYVNTTAYILNQIAYGSNGEVYTRKAGHSSSENQWNFGEWEKQINTTDLNALNIVSLNTTSFKARGYTNIVNNTEYEFADIVAVADVTNAIISISTVSTGNVCGSTWLVSVGNNQATCGITLLNKSGYGGGNKTMLKVNYSAGGNCSLVFKLSSLSMWSGNNQNGYISILCLNGQANLKEKTTTQTTRDFTKSLETNQSDGNQIATDTLIDGVITNAKNLTPVFNVYNGGGTTIYYKISGMMRINMEVVFFLQSRAGELIVISCGHGDSTALVPPKIKRLLTTHSKIAGFSYIEDSVYMAVNGYSHECILTQIAGNQMANISITSATQAQYDAGTPITIET